MEKKEHKTQISHPSLSKKDDRISANQPAQRGKSRIAPGAQKGYVVHDQSGAVKNQKPVVLPKPSKMKELSDEEVIDAINKIAPISPEASVSAINNSPDPALAAAQAARASTVHKLLSFAQPVIKKVKIHDMEFSFKMLSPSESTHISNILMNFPENDRTIFRTRILQAAAALVDVNGVALESLHDGTFEKDVVLMRYHEMMKWTLPVVESVIDAYETIVRNVRQEFKADFLDQAKTATTG